MIAARRLPIGVTRRLVLVRHGEPDREGRGRCYGRLDIGLSARGRRQLAMVRRHLRQIAFDAVYSSPRRRARESAELLAGGRCPIAIDERFGEINFGEFEGLEYDEIARRSPDLYEQWMSRPTMVRFPAGECFADMQTRVFAALADVRLAHPSGVIAIVSHAGVNRIALAEALGLQLERMFRIDQAHACVNVIDYIGDAPLVRLVNAQGAAQC